MAATNVFCSLSAGRQNLVYGMDVELEGEAAMVLPLPTKTGEESVSFVDLSGYPDFFSDMQRCFPRPEVPAGVRSAAPPAGMLEVKRVGAFEASTVPSAADWDRIDARFRLSDPVWRALQGRYEDFSFVVFQLQPGEQRIHPMALQFATRDVSRLYFPTLHVHDGMVQAEADFDHHLYFQGNPESSEAVERGRRLPRSRMRTGLSGDQTKGLVAPDKILLRQRVVGTYPNADTYVRLKPHARS